MDPGPGCSVCLLKLLESTRKQEVGHRAVSSQHKENCSGGEPSRTVGSVVAAKHGSDSTTLQLWSRSDIH